MEKYGTYVIFESASNKSTKVEIPLDDRDMISEFEKSAEWIKLDVEKESEKV